MWQKKDKLLTAGFYLKKQKLNFWCEDFQFINEQENK